jgi:hypothetical protein
LLINNEEVVEVVLSAIRDSVVIAVVIPELSSSTYSTKDLSFIVEVSSDKIGFSTNTVLLFDFEIISLFELAIICEDIVVESSEDRNEEIGTEVCDEDIGFKVLEMVD